LLHTGIFVVMKRKGATMAFTNVGQLVSLNPGTSWWWWYSWGPDHGTQFATADIKTPNSGAVHLADLQKKKLENDGKATYYVRITNEGPGVCWHNLQGGGVV
jgi:hypothetical protein